MGFRDILKNVTDFSYLVRPLAQHELPCRSITWEGSTSASYYILNIARQRSALGSESFVSRPERPENHDFHDFGDFGHLHFSGGQHLLPSSSQQRYPQEPALGRNYTPKVSWHKTFNGFKNELWNFEIFQKMWRIFPILLGPWLSRICPAGVLPLSKTRTPLSQNPTNTIRILLY